MQKTLVDLCLEKVAQKYGDQNIVESLNDNSSAILNAEESYIRRLKDRLEKKQQRHLFYLCWIYYVFYKTRKNDLMCAYHDVDFRALSHWKLAQWAAAEVVFGHFHDAEDCVARIRMELPFEHSRGRCQAFKVEKFEKALAKHCPGMKGNVYDWFQVFLQVPRKILEYETFFG